MTTATEDMREKIDRENDERSLHWRMERFTKRWATDLAKNDQAQFHADLVLLLQAVHRDANRDIHRLMLSVIQSWPPAPRLLPLRNEQK